MLPIVIVIVTEHSGRTIHPNELSRRCRAVGDRLVNRLRQRGEIEIERADDGAGASGRS
jgi:hypothetical protein